MSLLLSLSLLVLPLLAWYLRWRYGRRHMYKLAEKIPGPKGLPLIGIGHQFAFKNNNKVFDFLYDLSFKDEFKDIAKAWLGPKLAVVILNPADIELVLSSSVHLKKSNEYRFFEPWFGNGLLISTGDTWKNHRKLIAPTFHLNVLKRFMSQFNTRARCVTEKMAKENGKEFDVHDYMSECTVETLVETVMGVKQSFIGKVCYDYAKAVMDMCDILHVRQTRLWLRPEWLFRLNKMAEEHDKLLDKILSFTNKVFRKKKEDFAQNKFSSSQAAKEEIYEGKDEKNASYGYVGLKDDLDFEEDIGEKKRLAFLESMIERSATGEDLTDKDIVNQVSTIMFEGHDTTAAGSSFFLCVMAARPDIQAKCHEEIDKIFQGSDREVTFKDTLEMKYLERCIMETLRMFPPVPVIARELEQDLKIVSNDLTIPAGCSVAIPTFKVHRRADIYKNPDVFDPDNFLPENSISRHYYSFIPFSAGPRSCVGRKYAMLKLKIILAHILRKYTVRGGQPINQWKLQADIILKRTDGFNIALEPRKVVS